LIDNDLVHSALKYLVNLIYDNGWHCTVSPDLKKFRGPGRKDDPCPYANLVMLKALSEFPEYLASEACATGTETLLLLWENRKSRRPYLFAMGTDFSKLKAPLIWYDILHILEVLSRFDRLHSDSRFQEMVHIVLNKKDENGLFTPESIWRAWKDWEFGQKKQPSYWITFLIYRILNRINKNY